MEPREGTESQRTEVTWLSGGPDSGGKEVRSVGGAMLQAMEAAYVTAESRGGHRA